MKKTKSKKFNKDYGTGIKAGVTMGVIFALFMSIFVGYALLSISQEDFQNTLSSAIEENGYQYTEEQIQAMQMFTPSMLTGIAIVGLLFVFAIAGMIYGVLFVALINKIPGKKIYAKSIVLMLIFFIFLNIGTIFSTRILSLWTTLLTHVIIALIFGYFYVRFGKIKESIKDLRNFRAMF